MAAFIGLATTAEIALTAATPKTVLQLVAATNHRVKLLAWGVYFDGVSSTAEPVQVRLLRQTDAGTSSALTPTKNDDSIADTLLTTARHTATVEPTGGDLLKGIEVHPQSAYEEACPFGQEFIIGGGDRLGIECNAPAAVNVRAWARFEE
jgi:hypothetical protein